MGEGIYLKGVLRESETKNIKVISSMPDGKSPASLRKKRYLSEMAHLDGISIHKEIDDGKRIKVKISKQFFGELYSNTIPGKKRTGFKTKAIHPGELKNLDRHLENSTYLKSSGLINHRHNIVRFHRFSVMIKGKERILNVAEIATTRDGRVQTDYALYGVDVMKRKTQKANG